MLIKGVTQDPMVHMHDPLFWDALGPHMSEKWKTSENIVLKYGDGIIVDKKKSV